MHVQWIPVEKKETFENYCLRLGKQIDVSVPFSFIGLSFGGIVAVELAQKIKPKQLIIISSISSKNELPVLYKIFACLRLHKIISGKILKAFSPIIIPAFGFQGEETKKLLRQIFRDTSPQFLKWAINCILSWKNEVRPQNLIHIHGTADRILPFSKVKADYIIEKGGHMMAYDRAEEINAILAKALI